MNRMKPKHSAFAFLIVMTLSLICSDAFAQLPNLYDPLGQRFGDKPSKRSLLTRAGMEALTVDDEKETLAKYSKSSPDFENLFDEVVAEARQALVIVRTKGLSRSPQARKRQIALGTVVSEDGFVLTKASELRGELYCEFASGEVLAADLIGLDTDNDMALLKTDATGLHETGDWVATPLDQEDEIEVGVVSVDSRVIEPSKPFIGIHMNPAKPTGILIIQVQPKSPADEGGLKARDVILKLDDQSVKDIPDLKKRLEDYHAGDLITLSILRGEKQKRLKITLAEREKVSSENMRSNQQNSMGSRLSRRRKNFPLAFQHDTALQAPQCGGPIVDLDGKIVGVNIARAGRVSSLAIPIDRILPIVERLQTGDFSPVVVNAERIEKVELDIKETKILTRELSKKLDRIENENEAVEGTRRGLELAAEDIQKRLDNMIEEAKQQKSQLWVENPTRVTRMLHTMEWANDGDEST